MAPRTIAGKYRLYHRLGVGGMAEVYLAKQLGAAGFEKLVAVKMMRTDRNAGRTLTEMFIDEARLAAQLTHANVVQVFDFGEADGGFYLVMEYVHGVSLGRLLRLCADRGVDFPLALAVHVVRSICAGLDYAHRKAGLDGKPLGVIHRDVDPQNVFLDFEGAVKIGDFGIARAANRLHETTDGALRGKINYMAPEMLQDRPLDQRADLFSLGVTFFQLVAGQLPFEGENQLQTLERLREGRWRIVRDVRPDLPEQVAHTIERAMAFRREDRFASAAEMLAEIESYRAPLLPGDGASLLRAFFQTHFADLLGPPPLDVLENDSAGHTRVLAPDEPQPAPVDDRVEPTREKPRGKLASTAVTSSRLKRPRVWGYVVAAAVMAALAAVVLLWSRVPAVGPPPETPAPMPTTAVAPALEEVPPLAEEASPPALAADNKAKPDPPPTAPPLPKEKAPSGTGALSVGSDVGCQVSVDGKLIGATPVAEHKLAKGAHVVACVNAKLNATVSQSVTVEAGAVKSISFKLLSTLSVSVKPWAEVYLDDVKLGDTPLSRSGLSPGAHKIRLWNPTLGKEKTTTRKFEPGATVVVTESFVD